MKRRLIASTIAVLVAAAIAAAGWAYFQGNGSTSAGVKIGHSPVGLTLAATVDQTALYPGQSRTVTATITNDGTHGSVHAGTLSGAVDPLTLPAGCDPSWFSFAPVVVNSTLSTAGSTANASGALAFSESGTDQSACSDATPTLNLTLAP